jgi:hypothetical protein
MTGASGILHFSRYTLRNTLPTHAINSPVRFKLQGRKPVNIIESLGNSYLVAVLNQ